MRYFFQMLILSVFAFSVGGCADRDSEVVTDPYNPRVFFSARPAAEFDLVPLEKIPLGIKKFYWKVQYFNVDAGTYIFGAKAFDSEGNEVYTMRQLTVGEGVVSVENGNIVVLEPVAMLWIVPDDGVVIDESIEKPGIWKFEFFLNDHKFETTVEVVSQLVDQEVPDNGGNNLQGE
ncbi:hypothetical protein WDW89_15355 [Deltaproteobacteria bacterium TL4]